MRTERIKEKIGVGRELIDCMGKAWEFTQHHIQTWNTAKNIFLFWWQFEKRIGILFSNKQITDSKRR